MVDRGKLELQQLTIRLLASRVLPKRKWLLERIGHIWSIPKQRLRISFVTRHEKFLVHAEPTRDSLDAVRSFADDLDFNVRVATTFALGQRRVPDRESVPTLLPMLVDDHPVVRVNAAHALSHKALNSLATEQLRIAIENSTWSVRWTIAKSLSSTKHADIAWDVLRNSFPSSGAYLSEWLYACIPFADRLQSDESYKSKIRSRLKEMEGNNQAWQCSETFERMIANPKTT